MTAERDSMTLNEVSVPALGVEERSDEAPRAGRARPTPDPEVVAKPKRRQFTAEYRLADSGGLRIACTQPGEVGRLLRREGLYSSHPDGLAQGLRRKVLAAGVGREEARRETGRRATRWMPKVRALEAQVARLEHELHTAHTILDVQGKVAGLLGLNLEHGTSLLIVAVHDRLRRRSAWRRPAKHWACHGRPSTVVRGQLPGTSSPVQRPPGRYVKPSASRSSMCSPARASSSRAPAEVSGDAARRRPLPVLGADDVSDPGRRSAGPRASQSARASPVQQAELVATAPNQTWSWDITKLLGPTKWTYFYLYVVLDIFSRYAVGWMVADRENSALAGRLIEETCHEAGRPAPGARPRTPTVARR